MRPAASPAGRPLAVAVAVAVAPDRPRSIRQLVRSPVPFPGRAVRGQAVRLRVEAQDRARPRAGVRRREMDRPRIAGLPRTRFDRLPRQYERLLERIESGVDVRASSARLRALLATASPRLRTQISRLIRQEIRRLRKGGLTHQERAALRRLTPLLKALEASRPPAEISPPSDTASPPATSSESAHSNRGHQRCFPSPPSAPRGAARVDPS